MRHSPARRSFLAGIGASVRLTERRGGEQQHGRSASFPARRSPRRMWRLAMAVGMTGAGFCLVLAVVVLVVALGGGGHQRYRTTIVYEPRPVSGNGSASAVRYGLGLLVARFHGAGSVRGDKFRITRPGDWGISWQFSCAQGHPGNLTVRAGHAATSNGRSEGYGKRAGKAANQPGSGGQDSQVTFSASGHHGRGMSWYTSDPGDHTLEVISGCSWVIKIVLPKP